jgi:glycosyltransferase involved in cell wall biosynthesis
MKILIVSTVMSKSAVELIRSNSLNKGLHSAQKFFYLVAKGLSDVDGTEVNVYSIPPVSPGNYSKKWVRIKADREDQVSFSYQNVLNLPLVKSLLSFLQTLFYIVYKALKGEVNVIVLDALKVYPSLAALLAGKLLRKPVVAILTDVPGLDVFTEGWMKRLNTKISFRVLKSFDAYVFLTEPTNTLINQNHKPFIIMEGLIDSSEKLLEKEETAANKVILYSGGLYEKYGIKMLMDAVVKSKHKDLKLHLYGDGPMADTILEYHRDHSNISFYGNVPNYEMVNYQAQADLLINPRFTGQEYTLYTFPS